MSATLEHLLSPIAHWLDDDAVEDVCTPSTLTRSGPRTWRSSPRPAAGRTSPRPGPSWTPACPVVKAVAFPPSSTPAWPRGVRR